MLKSNNREPDRKVLITTTGCLVLPIVLLFLFVVGMTPYNNFRLWQFERRFAALSHPASSTFIKREKFIGLIGNGNHCDFVVAELRSHSITQQIRSFYAASRVVVPNKADDAFQGTKNGTQSVELEFLPAPLPRNFRWKYHDAFDWDLSHLAGQNLYVVIVHNSGESYSWESMCDWRCL